ncbi:unnamed protein product [Scytosiphon promiscuus]
MWARPFVAQSWAYLVFPLMRSRRLALKCLIPRKPESDLYHSLHWSVSFSFVIHLLCSAPACGTRFGIVSRPPQFWGCALFSFDPRQQGFGGEDGGGRVGWCGLWCDEQPADYFGLLLVRREQQGLCVYRSCSRLVLLLFFGLGGLFLLYHSRGARGCFPRREGLVPTTDDWHTPQAANRVGAATERVSSAQRRQTAWRKPCTPSTDCFARGPTLWESGLRELGLT